MNYVEKLNLFGIEAKEIPCIKIEGAPTSETVGAVGLLAMDVTSENGDIYKCTAADDDNKVYVWKHLSEETAIEPAEDDIPKVFFGAALPQTKNDTVMSFRYVSKTQDISGYCKTKAQGNSSMSYPKKNQTVKLYKDVECTEKLKINFKGWGEQNKFCFKANWIDITHARNVVSARLWGDVVKSRSDYNEIPEELRTSPNQGAVDGFPVKVYAAGIYQGRYTINIPKDAWMANMDDELDTHCILCGENYVSGCFRAEANIDGTDWTDEIHDTVPESIKTRWNEIINFVMNSTDEEFAANLSNHFDISSLIDYYLFGIASCGLDAFGKNQLYMTYDGQKWFATMYDMDATWGLWWNGTSFVPTCYSRDEYQDHKDGTGNLLYDRLARLFINEIIARWEELRAGVLSTDNVVNHFETFIDITQSSLVSEDYASTTADAAFTNIPSKSTNNIQQIREYVDKRFAWCDIRIDAIVAVPSDYTVVPFVQANGTQYIDTEISGGTNAEYEILFSPSSSTAVNYEQYFGGAGKTAVPKFYHNAGNKYVYAETNEKQVLVINLTTPNHGAALGLYKYSKDGSLTSWNSTEVFDNSLNAGSGWGDLSWHVFDNNEEGLMSSMRLYSLKMWTDGELVRAFVPTVRNSDGVAGLYDIVSDRFFESATDSSLTAFTGQDSEYRPSAELPDGYTEIVMDENTAVTLPDFPNNKNVVYGVTQIETTIPSMTVAIPEIFYDSNNISWSKFRGCPVICNTKVYNNTNYLCITLPTKIVGSTLSEVKAWLAEHNIVFYVKSA